MKNFKIGFKIALGIGMMLVVITVVIMYAFVLLEDINQEANAQAFEYLEEVKIAKNLETDISNMLYHQGVFSQNYNLTADHEESIIHLANAKEYLQEGKTLVTQFPKLLTLKENLLLIETSLNNFERILSQTQVNKENYDTKMDALDKSANVYMQVSKEYLMDQTSKFENAIKLDSGRSVYENRLDKITVINDIIDVANEIRVSNFKAIASNNVSLITQTLLEFELVNEKLNDLKTKSTSQLNIDQINQVQLASDNYYTRMKEMSEIMIQRSFLSNQSLEIGNEIQEIAHQISEKGLVHSISGANLSVDHIKTTKQVLIAGFLVAVLIGGVINYLIVKKIVLEIRNLTTAANLLAVGDINVQLNERPSKDEIGELTTAFSVMTNSIIEQAETVKLLALGEKGIVINQRSDQDVLNINLLSAVHTITSIQKELNTILQGVRNGEFDYEKNLNVAGFWDEMYTGVFGIVNVFKVSMETTNEYLVAISSGTIPDEIHMEYKGDFNTTKMSINKLIDAVNRLVGDTSQLISQAIAGDLSYRMVVDQHQGDYQKIVHGINQTLDAIIEPVNEAGLVLEALSNGDLSMRVRGDYKGDHAEIKHTLNQSMDTMQKIVKQIHHYLKNMAEGNLNLMMTDDFSGEFVQVKTSINLILSSFNQLLQEINQAADQVFSASSQVSGSAMHLAQGATEQASAVEEISASLDLVANQSIENANKSSHVDLIGKEIMVDAKNSTQHMSEMLVAMEEINDSSKNISKIIKVIDEIAFQTNILALNAAVEAARAGEQGKGFAVVAAEVRDLAARSAEAAKETTSLIEESLRTVQVGTEKATSTSKALEKIIKGVNESQEIISVIAVESSQQVENIKEISHGVLQISDVTQTNSATAEESASSSQEMNAQAERLKEMIGKFSLMSTKRKNSVQNTTKKQESRAKIVTKRSRISVPMVTDKVEYIHLDDDFGKYS